MSELAVYLAGELAGTLIRKANGNLQFRYRDDGGSPTLAPLYDLVSTRSYPDLTTRLAMSIDGAADIEEVDERAWDKLAGQAGYSRRFAAETTKAMVDRTVREADRLAADPAYGNATVEQICAGIDERVRLTSGRPG